jgi:indolepyruvate ferredoxin oxidoreductase alpha subunit
MRSILQGKPGNDVLLLGNEAIARGAIESGIALATTYPGTPASEIGDSLARIASDVGFYFEYSVNEKVALEVAIGASLSGLRALTSMKHVGVNVAADALLSLSYMGINGGLVLVSADDPACHSSQNEQDNRYYSRFAGVPMLEPSSPQECLDMVKIAFELSEQLSLPVIIRTTTRISHSTGLVKVGEIKKNARTPAFDRTRDNKLLPPIARRKHSELLQKLDRARELSDSSALNRTVKVGDASPLGIIASSAGFNYSIEASQDLGLNVDILKIGFSYPLPDERIISFLKTKKKVLIVEELEPLMEKEIRALAEVKNIDVEILGKDTGHFSSLYEYNPDILASALSRAFLDGKPGVKGADRHPDDLPQRPPVMCPGCPHSATYYAVKIATRGLKPIFPNDIGCYSLGAERPFNMGDAMLCMGASMGMAEGLSKTLPDPIIAFIGDSTFYHSGMPGLVNAIHNRHRFILIILDNKTTAMTGHQPHPGSNVNSQGEPAPAVSLEKTVEGFGVEEVRVIDPYDLKHSVEVIKEELQRKTVSVIISRRACALIEMVEHGKILGTRRSIDRTVCKKCGTCVDGLGCPAISRQGDEYTIDEHLCVGCSVCDQICPHKAIGVRK